MRLDRVWQNGTEALHQLSEVDSQLHRLERTTAMMCISHGPAAQAFYAHRTDESNPQVLVAELQGQLDLLARSMSRRRA